MNSTCEKNVRTGRNPEAPSKLNKQLKGDLDNIILRALRKEPERRYASAEQLAEDIRRHLRGMPVMATPDSVPYRIKKFLRRHKVGVAATALVLLVLASSVISTVREARIAKANRRRAEARFNDVRRLANSFLFEFDDAIRNLPGSTPARSLIVKRALEYLDGLTSEARGDRSLQMEIASAYQRVAEVQGDPMFPNLGDSKGALESSTKSLAILEAVSRAGPGGQDVQLALAENHQQISEILDFTSDTAGALGHSEQSLKIYDSLAGSMASDRRFQIQRVIETYHYANLLNLLGRLDEATIKYRQAVELSQQIVAANPPDQEGKIHLATSMDGLGNVLQQKGDTTGAIASRTKGLRIREELLSLDPNNAHYRRQLAFSYHNVGLSLVEAGDLTSALANFRKELSLFESLSAADPKDVQAQRNMSLAYKQIGDALMRVGDVHGAIVQYRAALAIDRVLHAKNSGLSQAVLDLSFSESKFGSALVKLGNKQEGLSYLRSGVARQELLASEDPNHVLLFNHLANSYTRLANGLLDSGNPKAAIEYYREAVDARLAYSRKSPNSSTNRGSLAECYTNLAKALARSNHDDALKQYNNAIELLEPLIIADPNNAQYRIALADALANTAHLYVQMAGEKSPAIRPQYWARAKSFYENSQKLWMELDKAGKLPDARDGVIQEVKDELAQCNDSLAKLQQTTRP